MGSKQLAKTIGTSQEKILSLLSKLISCPSVTPDDAGAQAILHERLEQRGFSVTPIIEGESRAFWAELPADGPLLVFSGHTDVVSPGELDGWKSDPFSAAVRDGRVYGRGAVDMKGNIAAFMVAIEELLEEDPGSLGVSLGVAIAGDEEGEPNRGTQNIFRHLQSKGRNIDYCLVTEPTSVSILGDTVKNGRRGSAYGEITIRGTQGHSAYPEWCDNPIHRSFQALHEIATYRWDPAEAQDGPLTTLQFTSISAGAGGDNIIPGVLEASFNIRYSHHVQSDRIKEVVEGILASHGLESSVSWCFYAAPFFSAGTKLLEIVKGAIKNAVEIDAVCSAGGGTSDARFIAPFCQEVVEFGLVGESMHSVNENTKVEDLVRLKEIYKEIILTLNRDTNLEASHRG